MQDRIASCRAMADKYDKAAYRVTNWSAVMELRLRAAQLRSEADGIEAARKCEKCSGTGKLSSKIGGKWVHYPQVPCKCAVKAGE